MTRLVKLSHYDGSDPAFILAGGGNTSVKTGGSLYIKASGVSLATIEAGGFVALDLEAIAGVVGQTLSSEPAKREEQFKQAVMAARLEPEKGQRPSVESVLHALAPGDFVVHSHSTLVNMVTCCLNGRRLAGELFGEEILWLEYVDPGYVLARSFARELAAWQARTSQRRPRAILMQNHGLIVSGDDPQSIRTDTDWVTGVIRDRLASTDVPEPFGTLCQVDAGEARAIREALEPILTESCGEQGQPWAVHFEASPEVMTLAAGLEGRAIAGGGPLTPDQIVYCKSFPLWLSVEAGDTVASLPAKAAQAVASHRSQWGYTPRVVLVEGIGLFGVGDSPSQAATAAEVYRDAIMVMAGAVRLGGIRYLPQRDREFIDNWEVEAYRRSVASKGQ